MPTRNPLASRSAALGQIWLPEHPLAEPIYLSIMIPSSRAASVEIGRLPWGRFTSEDQSSAHEPGQGLRRPRFPRSTCCSQANFELRNAWRSNIRRALMRWGNNSISTWRGAPVIQGTLAIVDGNGRPSRSFGKVATGRDPSDQPTVEIIGNKGGLALVPIRELARGSDTPDQSSPKSPEANFTYSVPSRRVAHTQYHNIQRTIWFRPPPSSVPRSC
ncbi:hypothetical protein BDY21DRAFT_60560 [Lineolata rhizophorae]|uniref:Uncharacterized protein n=1 Tax=Lineolata rhizophorae TaxID=578093 RepID=A0A6A6NW84_9PEZI|nr:hypothetical protein BDY21DRAFT_60560 [Lineolata rhizophorae]